MESRIANARALGFASFGIGVWMYCMALAGWFPESVLTSSTMGNVATTVTLGLFIAAIASFLRTDHWAAFFFMFWAATWWGVRAGNGPDEGNMVYAGWFFAAIAVVNVILFMAAMRDLETGLVRLVNGGIALAFVCWALGAWGLGMFFVALAGYIGLLTALAAFWAAATEALGGVIGKGGAKSDAATPEAGGV
ncbi:MAG: hypothetical protein LJF04_17070 [Gemmatimonadetes bacterium]|nr:hypothetical protein [Gemmatimonadota bacterium]